MTTNREWLYSLEPSELSAWFDAEHVETEERALDGDTAAPEAKIAYPMHHGYKGVKADMVIFDELHDEHDSREKLEADAGELTADYAASGEVCDSMYNGIIELLDRQAAITEEQTRCKWVTASAEEIAAWRSKAEKLKEQVYELTAERDKLKELNEYHALQYELASEDADRLQAQVDELKAERVKLRSQICKLEDDLVRTSDERDNWKANCEDWKNHARAAENACYETMLEREDYRKKFGKCIDYADAIHALMDDEGMA